MKSIEEIQRVIKEEIPNIDKKLYSDHIISIQLESILHYYGEEMKNKTIDELGLEKLGWNKCSKKIRRYTEKYSEESPF